MQIVNINLEKELTLVYNNQFIKITPFLSSYLGTVKLGIDASKSLEVNREEIYQKKRLKALK